MDINKAYKALLQYIPKEQILTEEPMKNHTSFRIGGPADIMVLPSEIEHFRKILSVCREYAIPLFKMGNGSNLLVRDKGIRGIVLKVADRFSEIWIEGDIIRAQSGVLLSKLSNAALRAGLAGLEFASGIPGTLGGAVVMNAGAYGGEMKGVIKQVLAMDDVGNEHLLEHHELDFGYRHSRIQEKGWIALEAYLQLAEGDYEQSKALIADLGKRRRTKQPLSFPSAGSVFKRPEGYYAGKLVEDSGLKGARCGDAQISELHANFIVNLGNATANDVISLIEMAKGRIKEKFGVEMIPEVRIVGEE